MVGIEELPDSLRNLEGVNLRNIPQLKYVVEMAERLCPNAGFIDYGRFFLQGATCIFLKRYFDGLIDTSFKQAYQEFTDLQESLRVFGIDPTAYWYLTLFLKDYVDDESVGEKCVPTAYTELLNLAEKLYNMGFCEDEFTGEYMGCKKKGLIKCKVGKHWLDITNDKALFSIFNAICSYLRKVKHHVRKECIDGKIEEVVSSEYDIELEHLFTISTNHERETITIPETYKISYFTRYMKMFLKPFSTDNRNRKISNDKWYLISMLIYTIGYSCDQRYITRNDMSKEKIKPLDFLKGNYQEHKYKYQVRRTIYV